MEDSTLPCFTQDGSASTTFWGSGNNSYAKSLCSPATFNGMGGRQCAKLAAAMAGVDLGFIKIMRLAAGNLFTGTFKKPTTTGYVNFGQEYMFKARPTALKVKYHAKVGIVDENTHNGPLKKMRMFRIRQESSYVSSIGIRDTKLHPEHQILLAFGILKLPLIPEKVQLSDTDHYSSIKRPKATAWSKRN